MKLLKFFNFSIVLSFLTISSVYCQNSESSKIVLFRTYAFSNAIKFLLNDSYLARLRPGAYSCHPCEPGEYTLLAEDIAADLTLSMSVDKGRTYYVRYTDEERVQEKGGRWKIIKPTLSLVDSAEAVQIIKKENLIELQNKNLWVRPKFRFDLYSNVGLGAQNTDMIELTNGDNSSISFGERLGCGIGITHEFLKFFHLSTDFCVSENYLWPDPTNVNVTFSVYRWSLTPYLVIPFDKGTTSLKIGIGKDYYFSPSLNIQASKMPGGVNDVWLYKNTNGFHFGLLYDFYDWKKASTTVSVKWYSVGYKYKSGQYYPTDKDLQHPNGSGVVVTIGRSFDIK